MKKTGKLCTFLLTVFVLTGLLSSVVWGACAQQSQDGLEVTITTDQDEYGSDEDITAVLTVTNTNETDLENIVLTNIIPEGYSLSEESEELVLSADTLAAGETLTLTAVYTPSTLEDSESGGSANTDEDSESGGSGDTDEGTTSDSGTDKGNASADADDSESEDDTDEAGTGDNSSFMVWMLLIAAAAAAIIATVIRNKRAGKSLLSLFLCAALTLGLITVSSKQVSAADVQGDINISVTVTAGGSDLDISAAVSYGYESTDADDDADTVYYTVTFETDGGTAIESQSVAAGSTAEKPDDPEKEGYVFIGWYQSGGFSFMFDFDEEITADTTVYAKYYDESDTTDSDNDGLTDSLEDTFGTDPYDEDTDDDGLTDYYELNWLNYNPLSDDTDGDGISDADEDEDGDGLTNLEEQERGLNPIYKDSDYDGLTDYDEIYVYGTDPLNADSDGDGVDDGTEVEIGSDPNTAESSFTTTVSSGGIDDYTTVAVTATVVTDAEGAGTLSISVVDRSDDRLLTTTIPGYLGNAYDFEIEGTFISGTLTFEYDTSLGTVGDDFQPRIYYYDEDEGTFEELDDQEVSDGTVTASVSHFSTYLLLNKVEFDEVWETEIKAAGDEYDEMTGIDIVFVIDSSGSMSSNDKSGLRKTAAKAFVDKLGENDRAAVVDFDSSATVYQDFTSDHDDLYTAIDKVNSSGGTNISNGMSAAINLFTSSSYTRTDAYKYIILLTDGDGTYSTSYTTKAAENDIVVYTIGLGSGVKESVLQAIADGTGGKYYFASAAEELADIYDDISVETVDYTTDSNGDGISDYYTELINSGKLTLSTGDAWLIGVTDMYGEDCDDWDGDGLKNGEEIYVKTVRGKTYVYMISDPLMVDTDGDGYDDYTEVKVMGTSPKKITDYPYSAVTVLTNDDYYNYVEQAVDRSASKEALLAVWDWEKQEEAQEVLVDYFYDYASEESIDANTEAIAELEMWETIWDYVELTVDLMQLADDAVDLAAEIDPDDDSSSLNDQKTTVTTQRKTMIDAANAASTASSDDEKNENIKIVTGSLSTLSSSAKEIDALVEAFTSDNSSGLDIADDVVENIDNLLKTGKSVIKLINTCSTSISSNIGDTLTAFNSNYNAFMNTEIAGIQTSSYITILFEGLNMVTEMADICTTYGQIKANAEAYNEYLEILLYIYENEDYRDDVRAAAGDVASMVCSDTSYILNIVEMCSDEAVCSTVKTALGLLTSAGAKAHPVIAGIMALISLYKVGLNVAGISEGVEYEIKYEVVYGISSGCKANLGIYYQSGVYFEYDSSDADEIKKYLTQLAQARIYGEYEVGENYTSDTWAAAIVRWIQGKSEEEIDAVIKTQIDMVYEQAEYLDLTLSSALPTVEHSSGGFSGGGRSSGGSSDEGSSDEGSGGGGGDSW